MPATMQSVTTRGYGTAGGFAGSANLVVTLGYGIGEAVTYDIDNRSGTGAASRTATGTGAASRTATGTGRAPNA
jgi:hypothetical protein